MAHLSLWSVASLALIGLQVAPAAAEPALLDAPSGLEGLSKTGLLEVSWEKPADATRGTSYVVYWDASVGGEQDCSNSVLQAGDPAPTLYPELVYTLETPTPEASLLHQFDRDVEERQYVAVSVVQRDAAGNVSPLSEVLCLQADAMDDAASPSDPAPADESGSCSVQGAGGAAGSGLPGGALFLAIMNLAGRRQRKHVVARA